jgi:hypothetical protein
MAGKRRRFDASDDDSQDSDYEAVPRKASWTSRGFTGLELMFRILVTRNNPKLP